jgi:CTP:molybdopterin cytidylyltransferase MocA
MIGVVVLAAGAGRRFSGEHHKLHTEVGGRPLHRWAIDAAVEAGLGPVFVVTGAVELDLPEPVVGVPNPRWEEGIATSLQAGIGAAREAGCDAVVVGLADQPGVVAEAWQLVAAADATPLAVATYDGERGNPVRIAATAWDELPTSGDEGARLLLRRCPELVSEVPCPGSPDDVDTVEDLRRWS